MIQLLAQRQLPGKQLRFGGKFLAETHLHRPDRNDAESGCAMLIYWLLFAYPAIFALGYPIASQRYKATAAQNLALLGFMIFFTLIAALRYEVGGDWETYQFIFDDIRTDTFSYALTATDPLFGLLDWISAQLGSDVYLANGICALILCSGVVTAALRLRDPWLAIMMAVPYLLIVDGMGYVRQGAAIGLILLAIASFDHAKPLRTSVYLVAALGFHSTAIIAFPLFAYALTTRYRALAIVFAGIGIAAYIFVLLPRLETFEAGYLDAEYESSGALIRILMSVAPSALLLLRWRNFAASTKVRSVWITMALANFVALAVVLISPASTAVDRLALFFAPMQMLVFGIFRDLYPLPDKFVLAARVAMIAVAAMVQVVWLVYATHASYWVPYQSVLQFL